MIQISKYNLLIIDDDDLVCETLYDIFHEKGYHVAIAKSGLEAINKAKQTTYDIAIIDIKLPDMNGAALLKEFKKADPEKICFIVTGHATLQNAISALKDGADDFFIKPLIIDNMVHKAQEVLEKHYLRQKLKESEEKYRDAYAMANFYKDLFAHDINNILNNIKASGELISLDLNNPEKFKDMEDLLGIIKDQVNRGAKLISNVQKLSQLEENETFIKSMEICKVLREAIQFTHISFPTKIISIQIESIGKKFFVQANTLLLDVFENLLNNGVKFNDSVRLEILIRISKFQKKGIKYIKIEFMDNGMGITDDRKKIIFQKTYKKDISVRGMGFGLSLVKKIMDSYNGEIWVEDNIIGDYTKGSNFIILIPEVV